MAAKVFQGMKEEDYYGDKSRMSASLLKTAKVNGLASARKMMLGQDKGSKAMREGWLAHLAVQFPDEFDVKCQTPPEDLKEGILNADGSAPKYPERTKAYAKAKTEWEINNPDIIPVTKKEMEATLSYREALWGSPCWRECDEQEIVVHFDFEDREYKARIDGIAVNDDGSVSLYDWKFVAGTRDFGSKIFRYAYHMQGALYSYAFEQAGYVVDSFFLVGVDKQTCCPSYTVCAPLSKEALDLGIRECRTWHEAILCSIATGYWPSVESPDKWEVPSWYEDRQ